MVNLDLRPLTEADAVQLHPVLDDPALHAFIGGTPETLPELRRRFRRWQGGRMAGGDGTAARPEARAILLNWLVLADGAAAGYVQATVDPPHRAQVAYVVGSRFQGQGVATEAARRMIALLAARGVTTVEAHISPDHEASARVAAKLGLEPAGELDAGGEEVWRAELPARAEGGP